MIAAATAGSLRWRGLANACRPTRAPYGYFRDNAATAPRIYEFPQKHVKHLLGAFSQVISHKLVTKLRGF